MMKKIYCVHPISSNRRNKYRYVKSSVSTDTEISEILEAIQSSRESIKPHRYYVEFIHSDRFESNRIKRAKWMLPGDFLATLSVQLDPGYKMTNATDIVNALIDYYGDLEDMLDYGVEFTTDWAIRRAYERDPGEGGYYCIFLKNEDTGRILIDERSDYMDEEPVDEDW